MLRQIRDLSVRLSGAREERDIFEACLDTLQSALRARRASILLFDERDVMRFVAWRELSDEYRAAVTGHTPWSPDSPGAAPIFTPDVLTDPSLANYASIIADEGIRGLAFFPLVYRNRVLGKFMVYSEQPRTFTEDEIAAGEVIAAEVAFGLARLRAEHSAAALTDRLEVLLASAPAVVWETVGRPDKTQQIVYVSEQIEALLGYPIERWYGEPNFWREVIVNAASFIDEGGRVKGSPFGLAQAVMKRADGSHVWTEVRTNVVQDEEGNAVGVRGVTIDITDRKEEEQRRLDLLAAAHEAQERAEKAERRTRFLAQFSDVLSTSLELIPTLRHASGLITGELADWCMIELVEESGRRRSLTSGHRTDQRPAVDLICDLPAHDAAALPMEPELLTELPADIRRWLATSPDTRDLTLPEGPTILRVPIVSGSRLLGSMILLSGEGHPELVPTDVDFAREIGARLGNAIFNAQLYRDLIIASRTKDEFLATLSHELRTPLTSIVGWASMMREGLQPEQQRLAIDTIHRSATLQRALIDDILDVSRITRGKLTLNNIPLDFAAIVRSCVNTMHPIVSDKGVTLVQALQIDSAPMQADAERLEQVVTNLLTNAIKFTPAGGSITISLARSEANVLLTVTDDGVGIAPSFLPDIFAPFRQADSSSTRQHQGLGLGLALVRSIVELHQGTVLAESDGIGRGARFQVSLPLHDVEPRTAGVARAIHPEAETRVLLIEDDPQTQELLATILRHARLEVKCSSNAEEAMRQLDGFVPDVLLTDVGLPDASAGDLLIRIRGAGCTAPAVALTGYAGAEHEHAILAAGFSRHLLKPVEPEALLSTIAAIVGSAR